MTFSERAYFDGYQKKIEYHFLILLVILAICAGSEFNSSAGRYRPQIPQSQIPKWLISLVSAGGTLLIYGILGFIGLILWRKIGLPGYLGRAGDQSAALHHPGIGWRR